MFSLLDIVSYVLISLFACKFNFLFFYRHGHLRSWQIMTKVCGTWMGNSFRHVKLQYEHADVLSTYLLPDLKYNLTKVNPSSICGKKKGAKRDFKCSSVLVSSILRCFSCSFWMMLARLDGRLKLKSFLIIWQSTSNPQTSLLLWI